MTTQLLFSYGTLKQREVQLSIFGQEWLQTVLQALFLKSRMKSLPMLTSTKLLTTSGYWLLWHLAARLGCISMPRRSAKNYG